MIKSEDLACGEAVMSGYEKFIKSYSPLLLFIR